MRTQFAGEESCGWPLRDGDRDEVVLRSHPIHRGLRGCAQLQSGRNPAHGLDFIGDLPTATTVVAPLSRRLPSARPAISVDPSPTPRPHHVHDECAGRRRSYGGSSIARVSSDKRATRVSRHLPRGHREEGMGRRRNQQARSMVLSTAPGPQSRPGLVPCPYRLRPPDQKGLQVPIADSATRP